MCGIAGIFGPNALAGAQDTLRTMLDSMAHRGPDGDGTWTDANGGGGIAHKRLAIIDPEGGQQPMTNEDETLWITFNGCIYNYQDIQRTLRAKGHRFRTHSDTEVIVHAYEEWGPACVEKFNGMWAFAIWDTRNQKLFCSRDRIGIKPFYFVQQPERFTFASEVKALLAARAVKPAADKDGIRHYLTFQYCLADRTMFQNVHSLPPGHNLTIQLGEAPQITQYWDLAFNIDTEHDEDYFVDRLSRTLEDAVRLRLRSDVPLGTHLSGGLDSSLVACLARLLLGDAPLKTFSGAFREGQAFDETRYAKIASEAARTEYLETYLSAGDFADSFEKIIWHMDQPAAGPGVFPQFFVSKLASEHVKVVLGGQGGDEIFVGYARYLVAYLEECLKGAIRNTAHRAEYVATLETIVPSLPTLESYEPMLRSFWRQGLFDAPAKRYFALMNRFADSEALLHPDLKLDTARTFNEFQADFDVPDAAAMINRILRFDLKNHLQSLLHVEDRTSMAWGLESRVPLLDYRLIELMASIPPVIKFKNGLLKYIFRKAVANVVPPQIYNRTDKMGFPVPFAQWSKGELRNYVGDLLLSQRCRERGLFNPPALEEMIESSGAFSRTLWGACCLETWYRKFIDQ
jgi:asparagine synthase (glutamine-hydrolysing)